MGALSQSAVLQTTILQSIDFQIRCAEPQPI
jgi:hypothetical protein